MEWFEFKNEIPLNTLASWNNRIGDETSFKFEGWTGMPREPYRHWAAYPEFTGVYNDIFECLNFSLLEEGLNLTPEKIIVNYYNHGDSSWLHRDCDKPGGWTVLLFANTIWDMNWGGDFVLIQDESIIKSFWPRPGDYIAFQSHILHGARPVSREAEFPRLGVVFQCTNQSKI